MRSSNSCRSLNRHFLAIWTNSPEKPQQKLIRNGNHQATARGWNALISKKCWTPLATSQRPARAIRPRTCFHSLMKFWKILTLTNNNSRHLENLNSLMPSGKWATSSLSNAVSWMKHSSTDRVQQQDQVKAKAAIRAKPAGHRLRTYKANKMDSDNASKI